MKTASHFIQIVQVNEVCVVLSHTNGSIDHVITFGLCLVEGIDLKQETFPFLQNFNVTPWLHYGEQTHTIAPTILITHEYR